MRSGAGMDTSRTTDGEKSSDLFSAKAFSAFALADEDGIFRRHTPFFTMMIKRERVMVPSTKAISSTTPRVLVVTVVVLLVSCSS
jgi:hypothetical protein